METTGQSEGFAEQLKDFFIDLGSLARFTGKVIRQVFKKSSEFKEFLRQAYYVGNKSLPLVGITAFILVGRKFSSASIKLEWRNLLFVGLTTTATFFFHMMALSLTLVVYVIAIKRTSGMMSVAFGHIFFSELNVRERLLGAAVMFVGVLFIIL